MPATEQTWRNLRWMHVVFGVSSLLMLVTTVWMLAYDHYREWKPMQRKFRGIEAWYTQARIDEVQDTEYLQKKIELTAARDAALVEAPPEGLIRAFLDEAKARAADEKEPVKYDVAAVERYEADVRRLASETVDDSVEGAREAWATAMTKARAGLIDAMRQIGLQAKFDEDKRFSLLKFRRADLDVARSTYNLGVGEGLPENELKERQETVNKIQHDVEYQTREYQNAKTHREALDKILTQVTAKSELAVKALKEHEAKIEQLEAAKADRTLSRTKELLDLPILDAFNSPLKIEQIWLPKLTWNNNFVNVARFDRCITCHQGIDKTATGSPTDPAYARRGEEPLELKLPTPAEPPKELLDGAPVNAQERSEWLDQLYGLELSPQGVVDARDVTVSVVRARRPAAEAQLKVGDVITYINDVKVERSSDLAYRYLLEGVDWGKPVRLRVVRGLPHPYSSHPRLDLYMGSLSPHKMLEVGCTVCHEGQGSGTSFQWTSHTPNDPHQMSEWQKEHGWSNNHHWIYPMRPQRFVESGCLKCHQEITELEPSERFPDPPAPKLMEGYNTIRQFGCFGCHEINGFDGPTRRRGPDIRLEPGYSAAAAQVLADKSLTDQERTLAQEVVDHPERTKARKMLAELIDGDQGEQPRLASDTRQMAKMLGADDETPGTYRKVGPSLRYVKSKLDRDFLNSWINNPTEFRPTTRMPRFFGLDDHLREIRRDDHGRPEMEDKIGPDGKVVKDAEGNEVKVPKYEPSQGLEASHRFEPIEVRAVTEYLLSFSQPFEYLDRPKNVNEQPSSERGKVVFQTRGCLACHQHADFPEAKSTQGPDLSRIGDKLTTADGARWLYSWVREPKHYHARTVMPNLFLEPIAGADGRVSDPAADVTEFLLKSRQNWQPQKIDDIDEKSLDELASQYLAASFTVTQTNRYLAEGIPQAQADQLKVDERLLVATDGMTRDENRQHKMLYVGRRTIGRLGCAACHDIPGFEDSKPIGTGLADWGRKEPDKLAFEQVVQYLAQQRFIKGEGRVKNIDQALDPHNMDPDTGFFIEAILNHERDGFIWQKLREPRSYDYRTTENKQYIERLRMPKFNLTDAEREAVITFVLGLVAEPPAAQYIYKPTPRRKAIVEGERLLTKFNCGGCHTLQMESWEFDYDPSTFPAPPATADFAFELPHFTPKEFQDSKKTDRRGLGHAIVTGMVNPEPSEDDDGNPLYYFGLWKSLAINGHAWVQGGPEVPIQEHRITAKHPPVGGDFARLLHPVALAMEQQSNPNAKASDAWGWVPPPLVHEGEKVQTQWLHDFLLNPYPIRPAAVLRMPKFNMSSEEAAQLANYFAAVDDARFPYQLDFRTESSYIAAQDEKHPHRFGDALRLITSNDYCVKCHKVGDFTPLGSVSALAPNLDQVYNRLRGDYLQKWIGNPKRMLPYTGMPVNFPPDKPADQKLFPGTSLEQVEGVVDFLLNYDNYMKNRTSIRPLIQPVSPTTSARPDGTPVAGP